MSQSVAKATNENAPWRITKDLTPEEAAKCIRESESIMLPGAHRLLAHCGIVPFPADNARDTTAVQAEVKPFTLLDTGCGPGVIASALYSSPIAKELLDSSTVICADISAPLVSLTAKRAQSEGWAGVSTQVLDARDTTSGVANEIVDFVTCNFCLHLIDPPDDVLQDALRVLKPGGTFAFATMHSTSRGFFPDLEAAFSSLAQSISVSLSQSPADTPDDSFATAIHPLPAGVTLPPNLPRPPPFPVPFPMQTHSHGKWSSESWISSHLSSFTYSPTTSAHVSSTFSFEDVKTETILHKTPVASVPAFLSQYAPGARFMWSMWPLELREALPFESAVLPFLEERLGEMHPGPWDLEWAFVVASGKKG